MDSPYIIWTVRRTGGTTLASIMAHASSYPVTPHEPFNPDRIHGKISKNWAQTGDVAQLQRDISEVLDAKPVIKHCFEIVPMQLNVLLLQEASRRGYHHILLRRRSEVDRLFSLEVANQTGAWGPDVARQKFPSVNKPGGAEVKLELRQTLTHMADCLLRTRWLQHELRKKQLPYKVAEFEALYETAPSGVEKVSDLLQFVNHDQHKIDALEGFITEKLSKGSQDTKKLNSSITNAREWRRIVRENWHAMQGLHSRND